MTRFLATAATALVLGTAAYADNHGVHSGTFSEMTYDQAMHLNASEVIGSRVYATENDVQNTVEADGEKEWDDIGEINEVVLTRDGKVQAVIIGVGGFLGVGEKDVSLDMSQLKIVTEQNNTDDWFFVVNASVAQVKDAPAYGHNMDEAGMKNAEKADAEMEASNSLDSSDGRPMLSQPDITRDGYANVEADELTAENLTGARVYGAEDEDIGEVGELLLTDDGKMDRAVIDIGGFLGMGEHTIAVSFDEMQIVRSDDGNDVRVYIDSSEEALKAQPEYES